MTRVTRPGFNAGVHVYKFSSTRLLSDSQFDSSLKITSALVAQIVQQDYLFSITTVEAQHLVKSEVVRINCQAQADLAVSLHQSLSVDLQKTLSLSNEKGAHPGCHFACE